MGEICNRLSNLSMDSQLVNGRTRISLEFTFLTTMPPYLYCYFGNDCDGSVLELSLKEFIVERSEAHIYIYYNMI